MRIPDPRDIILVLNRIAGQPYRGTKARRPSPTSNVMDQTSGGHPPASITVNGEPLSHTPEDEDS